MLPGNTTHDAVVPALSALKAVSLFLLIIWTIAANGLVFVVLYQNPKLRTVPNLLVANLAFSDFMLGLLVLPLSATYTVVGSWISGKVICEFWLSLDVLICTSSIWNLSMVGLDRYWAITKPVDYMNKRTVQSAAVMIAAVWGISGAISLAPLAGWKYFSKQGNFFTSPDNNLTFECSHFQDLPSFTIYSATGSFYIPMLLMFYVYYRIYKAFLDHQIRHNYRHNVLRKHLESTILRDLSNVIPEDEPNRPKYSGFVTDSDSESEDESDSNNYVQNDPSESGSEDDHAKRHEVSNETTPLHGAQAAFEKLRRSNFITRRSSFSCQNVMKSFKSVTDEKRNSTAEISSMERIQAQSRFMHLNRSVVNPSSVSVASVPVEFSSRNRLDGLNKDVHGSTQEAIGMSQIGRPNHIDKLCESEVSINSTPIQIEAGKEDSLTLQGKNDQKCRKAALAEIKTECTAERMSSHAVLDACDRNQTNQLVSEPPSVTINEVDDQNKVSASAQSPSQTRPDHSQTLPEVSPDGSTQAAVKKVEKAEVRNNHVRKPQGLRKDLLICETTEDHHVRPIDLPTTPCDGTPQSRQRQVAPLPKEGGPRNPNEPRKPKGISAAKEKRGVKVLGIILGCFTLCWLPFFIMYFVVAFCKTCQTNIHVEQFITWLGYANSAMNPIIYTVFNRDYQVALRRLVKKQNRLRPS